MMSGSEAKARASWKTFMEQGWGDLETGIKWTFDQGFQWEQVRGSLAKFTLKYVDDTRIFIMEDQPKALDQELRAFISGREERSDGSGHGGSPPTSQEQRLASKVKAVPDEFTTVSAHLPVRGAAKAIDFYKKAFDAEEVTRMNMPDGKSKLYAELKIDNSRVMLCDEIPGFEFPFASPQSTGKTTVLLHLSVENADAAYDRAIKAGATATMPLMNAFWGDRYGRVTDPFGHVWSIATHKQDLTPAQLEEGAKQFFANMDGKH